MAPVRKPHTDQDTADEEVRSVVFLLGSVEPRLPFGWLQLFAALMEILKKKRERKKEKKKGGEETERDPE